MRIVEYQKQTTALPYQLIKSIGWVAGIFSLVVCALIIANNLSLKKTDPIHSPALQVLVEQLKGEPKNETLREEIRELDQIARRAFFTSQHFNRLGIYLLVGGLVVMVIALKSLEAFKTVPPYPDSSDPKDDIVENAAWARKAVTAVGLVLVGFALMIALPWQSTLDMESVALAGGEDEAGGGDAGGETKSPAPAPTPTAAKPDATTAPAAVVETSAPQPPTDSPAVGGPVATREQRLENWPEFLGPQANRATARGLLSEWNGESGEGIQWKTKIPLSGYSSPILWDGKIYLSGADETTREIYCIDSASGEILWQKAAENVPGSPSETPEVSVDTGYAAATMASDGVRVFAMFSNGDLVALGLDGKPAWSKNIGVPENPYGHSSSLVIHEDIVIVQFDREADSFVAGFDVASGEQRWKTTRDFGPSWSTPTLADTGERVELILAADPAVVSYDPADGKELWRVDCLDHGEVACRPVYADGLVYVSADAAILCAIDIKTQQVVWENDDLKPGVSTPLALDGHLYCATDDGAVVCYDAKTGEELWAEFADNGFYASPILAEGRIYLMDRSGITHILKHGKEYEVIAQPELGEEASCTAAILGDSLYIRATENLYRIAP